MVPRHNPKGVIGSTSKTAKQGANTCDKVVWYVKVIYLLSTYLLSYCMFFFERFIAENERIRIEISLRVASMLKVLTPHFSGNVGPKFHHSSKMGAYHL